jgi:hypothetical protein
MQTTTEFTYEDDDGVEHVVQLPAKFEVCGRCEGHGTHLHPAIGEHAYSVEEFNEAFDDDESRAAYFQRGGMYDVTCEQCGGKRVVAVVDEEALERKDPAVFKAYTDARRVESECRAEEDAERRYFAMMGG